MTKWSDYRCMVKAMAADCGVTLNNIAKHVGVSRQNLNQIMQAGPSEKQQELIAEALGCAGCDLVEIHRQIGELTERHGQVKS